MATAAAFWIRLEAAEQARRERERLTREVKVRPQYRAATNDEPEPTLREIEAQANAEARAIVRGVKS